MGKLNAMKIRNIVHNWKYKAKARVSPVSLYYRIRQILSYYQENHCLPVLHQRGRKKSKIPEREVNLILSYESREAETAEIPEV